jgi:hypothetical protein
MTKFLFLEDVVHGHHVDAACDCCSPPSSVVSGLAWRLLDFEIAFYVRRDIPLSNMPRPPETYKLYFPSPPRSILQQTGICINNEQNCWGVSTPSL